MPDQDLPAFPGPTYEGAPDSLIQVWNVRRRGLTFAEGEALPPLDVDLRALAQARVAEPATPGKGASGHAVKQHEIRKSMVGQSELAALNALLIAHLRKKRFPRHAPRLFRRLWTEEADTLLAELPPRWLISSVITFGDHGWNEGQRRVGLAMNVLFSLMKLYEFERLFSGLPPDRAHPVRRAQREALPLDMPGFSLLSGGLDINLLAQVWDMARQDPLAGRIACHLLQMLNDDPRSLFRRLGLMREDLIRRREAKAAKAAGAAD
ncbi:MAG: hypothetical protein R3D63_13825 [Paracoccaceae bacterium]